MKEVPDREVVHDFDDDGETLGSLVGEAGTLPMTSTAKRKARERRERLDEIGGFGFGLRDTGGGAVNGLRRWIACLGGHHQDVELETDTGHRFVFCLWCGRRAR